MKKIVLFVSAGRTDLQLMTTAQHTVNINKDSLRIFHDWLSQHPESYVIKHQSTVDFPLYAKDNNKSEHHMKIESVGEGGINFTDLKGKTLYRDAQGRCLVVPSKIGPHVALLQSRPDEYEIAAAVVFNTQRELKLPSGEPNVHAEVEPYANGKILAQWLASCFGLQFSASQQPALGQATWLNLLQGIENQEGKDKFINTCVVNRVADALQIFANMPGLNAHALDCGIGGIPAFKDLIRNTAYFYFPERCLLAKYTENQQSTNSQPTIDPVGNLHITPEQSFTLRANVAKLIASGDFLGAEAAIRHVEDDIHQAWIKPIRHVANWFRGIEVTKEDIDDQELSDLLIHAQAAHANCSLPGLRTEAALQGGRYVEAISATAAYIDAALTRGIHDCLKSYGSVLNKDIYDNVTYTAQPKFPNIFTLKYRSALYQKWDKSPVPLTYFINPMGTENREIWAKASGIPGLSALIERIDNPPNKHCQRPYSFRNTNTHNVLSPEKLIEAQQAFEQANLWLPKKVAHTATTLYFLDNPEVKAVAGHFKVPDIGAIYLQLVNLLEARLAGFRWPGSD